MKHAKTRDGMALGRHLRALRDETGLSRRLVARHVGMSNVTLMLIESGQTRYPSFTFVRPTRIRRIRHARDRRERRRG